MDKYDKQIAKINKKKQKALEKQAKIQAELEQMTDEDLKYQRAIQVGKISVARTIKNIIRETQQAVITRETGICNLPK